MLAAITIISGILICVVGWCLAHSQRCADRDAKMERRITQLEMRHK